MDHKLPARAREFVLFQRTELLPKRRTANILKRLMMRFDLIDNGFEDFVRQYAAAEPELIDKEYFEMMLSKARLILPYIPEETTTILDIGCGIAALDLFLFESLKSPNLILLDKTAIENKIWYMFEAKGAFYNSLELASETLISNGVSEDKIRLMEAPSNGIIDLAPKSVDLVVSTISWGFHYPVSTYLNSVAQLLSANGVLIIDVRKNTGAERELDEFFSLNIIDDQETFVTIRCTLK